MASAVVCSSVVALSLAPVLCSLLVSRNASSNPLVRELLGD